MKKFIRENSLSIVFLMLFLGSLVAQAILGMHQHNEELIEKGGSAMGMSDYLTSGHFVQATFENWESEFLQMALFVWFTIFLRQKGSSESKGFDKEEEVDREPNPRKKDAPWPVRKGGIVLKIYQNSLTIVLFIMFFVSFWLHFEGSLSDENTMRALKKSTLISSGEYIASSRFWFESFQNWQSEFLSVFAIIFLSIYLRQKGSSQSKPVDAPHDETGE